ncbi:MAG: prepilin-type N-terminal cleavage/methylation domain-containing protein [Acidobacteria bacterium]|nr:prepilin-type N-terminal cleavage/methylation domain-containing protein [Acidobacteriota bacterium]
MSRKKAAGFSLIETMAAIMLLSFGVLALAAVYTQGMAVMGSAQFDYIAQQKAAEAIETVFTARDTKVLTWDQIRNGGGGPGDGAFPRGPQPLLAPGPDGLVGTLDDDANKPDSIVMPGPDGALGTQDDVTIVLKMFTREIQITDIAPNLRQISVIIKYKSAKFDRTYTLVSYISSFA